MSAWVERGVLPPDETSYKIVDGQVVVPADAAARKGFQPVVDLTVNGGKRLEVKVGQPMTFSGVVEAPPGTGKVVSAEWDFEGAGTYPVVGQLRPARPDGSRATVAVTYSFSKEGTYFPALRVAYQREGDPKTAYGRILNLDRVRVVVR